MASPSRHGRLDFESIGGAEIALNQQGRVYRTNVNRREFFAFRGASSLVASPERRVRGDLWLRAEGDGATGARKVAIVSPKTTDVLAVRTHDGSGIAFFDEAADIVARRAAWYSAATILQRAIALELDVDSLDIEIASIHQLRDESGNHGTELLLADAHPNGAGLVAWARLAWPDLLRGCLTGEGPTRRMGALIRAEQERQLVESWRSPDLLLKGFRNRPLHGLLDWGLGLELLATLATPSYRPGLDEHAFSGAPSTLPVWLQRARSLVQRYTTAFAPITRPVQAAGPIVGWQELDASGTFSAVVHPLWSSMAGARNGITEVVTWASAHGARRVRLIDVFNLDRRMSWVRARRDDWFPAYELGDLSADASASAGNGTGAPGTSADDPRAVPVGESFELGGTRYERVADVALATVSAGDWLASLEDTPPVRVIVRWVANRSAPFVRVPGGQTLRPEQVGSYTAIARAVSHGAPQ